MESEVLVLPAVEGSANENFTSHSQIRSATQIDRASVCFGEPPDLVLGGYDCIGKTSDRCLRYTGDLCLIMMQWVQHCNNACFGSAYITSIHNSSE